MHKFIIGKGRIALKAALFILVCGGGIARAEDSTAVLIPTGISTSTRELETSTWRKKLYVDFLTTYHGPTLQGAGPYSLNGRGDVDPAALSGFDSEITTAYILDEQRAVGVGPDLPFFFEPTKSGKSFVLGDVGVKAFDKRVVATDHVRLYANLTLQAPTSDESRARSMTTGVRTTPFLFYDIGQTRWRIGTWTDFKYSFGVTNGMQVKAWVGPYVNYKISDRVALNLMYETEAHHDIGDAGVKFHNVLGDLQPGLIWQVTKTTKLNPYLVYFPNQSIAGDHVAFGTVLATEFL